jgi:uncharacterized membrane protein YwaF
MTAIEVGSFFWFVGFAVLALMALFLFFLAPKEGSEKWIQWKKVLGIIIFLNQAFYWVSSISDGTFTLQESLPLHMCGVSQLMLFAFLAFDVRKVFPILVFWGPFRRDPSIPHPCLYRQSPHGLISFSFTWHTALWFWFLFTLWFEGEKGFLLALFGGLY